VNRIDTKFAQLKQEGKKAFIAFITAGDPDYKTSKQLVLELEKQGVDIVELGVPFSDPLADGPIIQKASERALKAGASLKTVLKLVGELRRSSDLPLCLMTYYNPVLCYGLKRFCKDASTTGVDGLIVPDLSPEEAKREGLLALSQKHNVAIIFLLSPTSTMSRIKLVCETSKGFIYYVSLTGTTGVREKLPKQLGGDVRRIKKFSSLPLAVGFGVSNPSSARQVAKIADGVIVGSAIVRIVEQNLSRQRRDEPGSAAVKKVGRFVRKLVKAVKE